MNMYKVEGNHPIFSRVDQTLGKPDADALVAALKKAGYEVRVKPVSPNAICRAKGCRASVPPWGWYPGLTQSHCPRCGMITYAAAEGLPDFKEASYPEWDGFARLWEKVTRFIGTVRKNITK